MLSNLPPGVTERDLPGNSAEDEWIETVYEHLDEAVYDAMQAPCHYLYNDLHDYFDGFDPEWNPYDVANRITQYYYDREDDL